MKVLSRQAITINGAYKLAGIAGAVGLALIAWVLIAGQDAPPFALVTAAAVAPLAVLGAVWGRLGQPFPWRALVIGAVVGPAVAIVTYPLVAAFAFAFILGFADSGRHLVESLQADPRLVSVLASPWVIVLLVEVVTVAPLTEEFGKALSASWARPVCDSSCTRSESNLSGPCTVTGAGRRGSTTAASGSPLVEHTSILPRP